MMVHIYSLFLLAALCRRINGFAEQANCPKSCYCEVDDFRRTLTITNCFTDPLGVLDKVFQNHYITNLKIIKAGLSSVGDISYVHTLTSLDLRYNNFTSLSYQLSSLPKLSKLVLSHNNVETVRCNISRFKQLRALYLDNNNLTSVQCGLSTSQTLVDLDLSHNDIKTVDCDMSQMKALRKLNLDYNKLVSFQCELSTLPKLYELHLSYNNIQKVDCDMSHLKELRTLFLDYNRLTTIPCELSKLTKLDTLMLSHNEIQAIDCDLSQLENLKFLILTHNKLTSISSELSKLYNLLELHLSHNYINRVECDLSKLVKLQTLLLLNNSLQSFPCELLLTPDLTNLHVAQNYIQRIDCKFDGVVRLRNLYLEFNNLTSVPCQLSKLEGLSELILSHNNIQEVDCVMSQFTDLHILDLDYNELRSVPCELSKLPKLSMLRLSSNDIATIDCPFKQLHHLFLDNNKLKKVPCELLQTLYELRLSNNNIDTLHCDISQMARLKYLHLDHNNIEEMPCNLSNAQQLSLLSLSNNAIQDVHCDMSRFKGLKHLHLDNNKLVSVPCGISKLPKLSQLSLAHNAIEALNCDLSELKMLTHLSLANNLFQSLPCELLRFPYLTVLNTSHNNIQKVDCGLSKFTSLEYLDLSYNNLTSLPLLTRIRKVNVSNNAIIQFTKKVNQSSSCKDIPEFNFENNYIFHLKDIFIGWGLSINNRKQFEVCIDKLTERFSGNPLICDCNDFQYFKALKSTVRMWTYPCFAPIRLKGQNPITIPLDKFVCNISDLCPVGCSCINVPGAKALRVSCMAYTGATLPENLPVLENGNMYEFDMRGSHLKSLPFRLYLSNTTKARFGYSVITSIPLETLKALAKNVKVLHLNNNNLQSLPQDITSIDFRNLTDLRLDNNPWHCDCQSLALRDFVIKKYSVIKKANLIRCHFPTDVVNSQIDNLARNYFCHRDHDKKKIILIAVITSTCYALLLVSVILSIRKRRNVQKRVPINVQNTRRIMDEHHDEGKEFDVFVSYATEDEEYVGEWLIPKLERSGFKVCFHRVHFLGGVPIHVNMHQCIDKSKRTLAFFSQNFVDSNYSMYEFDLALCIDIDAGTRRLVTIKETTLDINTLEPSYAVYFETHTYIEQGAVNFWKNLLFTLPQNKMGVVEDAEVDEHAV